MTSANDNSAPFTCPTHGETMRTDLSPRQAEEQGLPFGCGGCAADLATRPDADTLTGEERAAELRHLLEHPMTVPFPAIHERTAALVGRDVWTHEFAAPDRLYAEAESQKHPSDLNAFALHSLEQLAGEKPVVVVPPGATDA